MITPKQLFLFFASLKLAVISILGLAAILAVGTIVESLYGMRAASLMVYGTWWFGGVLFFLGLNVLCAALSRYPWKKHQIGFLVTHSGIIVLLVGSALTQQLGLDGNLPVEENNKNDLVLLSDLKLHITDEDSGQEKFFQIPETGRSASGELLQLALFDGFSLHLDTFFPRSVLRPSLVASPVKGLGQPAIRFDLSSSRFNVSEKIVSTNPEGPTEVNLGPAIFSFQKLWTKQAETDFLISNTKSDKGMGHVIAFLHGREYRLRIEDLQNGWQPLGDSGHQVRATKYYSHAVVEGKDLVDKSDEPVNPALEILLKSGAGQEERHTIFANFPDFPTLHRRGQAGSSLGVSLQMISFRKPTEEMGIVGRRRGELRIAQSADNKRLLYKVLSASGKKNHSGELEVGKAIETGWMDAQFKITKWEPSGVMLSEPKNVDRIAGGDTSYLSAVHFWIGKNEEGRVLASEVHPAQWLVLGETKRLVINNRRLLVRLTKDALKLPFSIELEKFNIGRDPGTNKAASYESRVRAINASGGKEDSVLISMNEPLHHMGYTLYQASYQERPGQPYVSIFSVNKDPGRWVKYIGSLLLVFGISIMFYMNPHYFGVLLGKKQK